MRNIKAALYGIILISPCSEKMNRARKYLLMAEISMTALRIMNFVGTDISMEELSRTYDRVFAAPGAWKKTVIGMGGEELTRFGLEFLVEVKGWMQDKPGKWVAVVGGGNVAVDVAVTAKRLGAEQVTMISLESREELPATREELERAEQEGVRLMPSWGPTDVGRILRTFKIKKNVEVTDNGKIII